MKREPPLPSVSLCFSCTHGHPTRRPAGLCPVPWDFHPSNSGHSVPPSTLPPALASPSTSLLPIHLPLPPPLSPSTADRAVATCPQPLRCPVSVPALCLLLLGSRTNPRTRLSLNRMVNLEATRRSPSLGHIIFFFLERLRQKLFGSDRCLCRGLSGCDRQSHLFISQSLC